MLFSDLQKRFLLREVCPRSNQRLRHPLAVAPHRFPVALLQVSVELRLLPSLRKKLRPALSWDRLLTAMPIVITRKAFVIHKDSKVFSRH